MMNSVKQRSELYDEWASRVTETLEAKLEKKKGKQQKDQTDGFRCLSKITTVSLHLIS